MFPTGAATLLSGATTTSFGPTAVTNEDPHLNFESTSQTWKTTSNTPLYSNAVSVMIPDDIEGQPRPLISNPGADHLSTSMVRFKPLTAADVGPYANGNINSPSRNANHVKSALIFPIPANDKIHLTLINEGIEKVDLLDLHGKVLISHPLKSNQSVLLINTSELKNGSYLIRFSNEHQSNAQKLIIQR